MFVRAPHPMKRAAAWGLGTLLMLGAPAPAGAQEKAAETGTWDMERAFGELERLQAEVAVLKGIARTQAALLAWNRERADSGAGPAALSARLCSEPALAPWCRALPATFGAHAAEAADHAHGKDGER